MGQDGSGKYEVRFPNGTVIGNFTYINDQGERETRWYSAGDRGTEIAGDSVISPAPPTLVDETTGPNYVDLSNYELYRHLEVPYVHIEGPSDPDERGQLSNPNNQRQQDTRSRPQPSQQPLDFGDELTLTSNSQAASPQRIPQPLPAFQGREAAPRSQAPPQVQSPQRVVVQKTPVANSRGRVSQQAVRSRAQAHFNAAAIDNSNPNTVLDSLIRQFQ